MIIFVSYVGGYFVWGVDGRDEVEADPSRDATTWVVGEVDGGAATTITGFMSCLLVAGVKYWPPIIGIDPDFNIPICHSFFSPRIGEKTKNVKWRTIIISWEIQQITLSKDELVRMWATCFCCCPTTAILVTRGKDRVTAIGVMTWATPVRSIDGINWQRKKKKGTSRDY